MYLFVHIQVCIESEKRGRDFTVYSFDGFGLTELSDAKFLQTVGTAPQVLGVKFSGDDSMLSVCGNGTTSGSLEIYPVGRDTLIESNSNAIQSLNPEKPFYRQFPGNR